MKNDRDDIRLNKQSLSIWPQSLLSGFFDNGFLENLTLGGFKVDIKERKDAYIIDAEMPGMDKKDVDIDINDDCLTITAHYEESREQKDEDGHYIRRERRSGTYHRSFSLDNIQADRIKAEMKNGVLTIVCPKKNETPPNTRRIPIQ